MGEGGQGVRNIRMVCSIKPNFGLAVIITLGILIVVLSVALAKGLL